MLNYQRILAVVDLSAASAAIIRRALQLARQHQAKLRVVSIVEHDTGFESDHIPFLTPQQLREATARQQSEKLDLLLARLGAPGVEAEVLAAESARLALSELLGEWRPDMMVVGSRGSYGLPGDSMGPLGQRCDWLTVQIQPAGFWNNSVLENAVRHLGWLTGR
jgi:nucleotide-binding universal stress UspA family protein